MTPSTNPSTPATTSRWLVVQLILVLGATGLLLAPTLQYGFGFDHGSVHYVAWAAWNGVWPYVGSWDTFFPGSILIHMLAEQIGPPATLSLRILDLIAQLSSATLMFLIGARLSGSRAGAIAVLFYDLTYIRGGYYNTAQRDGFIVPLMLLTVLTTLQFRQSTGRKWLLLTGILLGFVCLVRPTYLLIAIGVMAYIIVYPAGTSSSLKARLISAFAVGTLAAFPLVLFVGIYLIRGEISYLTDTMQFILTVYPRIERASVTDILAMIFLFPSALLWIGVLLSLITRPWSRRDPAFLLVFMALICSILIRGIESKTYLYQFWPVFACAAILAGVGWDVGAGRVTNWLGRFVPAPRHLATWVATITLLVLPFATRQPGPLVLFNSLEGIGRAGVSDGTEERIVADRSDQAVVARYLREHTLPEERVQLWGLENGVYYAARRLAPGRFADARAFRCPDSPLGGSSCDCGSFCPTRAAWWAELVESIKIAKPRYIVAYFEGGSLAHEGPFETAPDFPELRAILLEEYEKETMIGIWSLYRRRV